VVDVHAFSTAASPASSGMMPAATEPAAAAAEKQLPPRILLVARPGDACTLYEAAIRHIGATVDTVASIDTFYGAVTHLAYNGVVIDIPTKIKALSDHKDLVYSITGRFPVIQVNLDRRSGAIRALLYGHHERSGLLADLIREVCWDSPPRKLRSEERQPLHYNVLLSTTRDFDPRTLIRTVTMDVSSKGCFLFSSSRFQLGGRVWMRIIDLYDKSPISGIVRHKRKWGEAMVVPGIGIEFESISESQRQALLNPVKQSPQETEPGRDLQKGAP
jgi:PilZ domain